MAVLEKLGIDVPVIEWADEEGVDDGEIRDRLYNASTNAWLQKPLSLARKICAQIEKQVLLQTIDGKWREHLLTLEHLRSVVGFRGYAQRDPLNEYKNESFQLFESMLNSLREDVSQKLSQIRPMTEDEQQAMMQQLVAQQAAAKKELQGAEPAGASADGFDGSDPTTWGNPGRNDSCPCGSGKKFKHCHGRLN